MARRSRKNRIADPTATASDGKAREAGDGPVVVPTSTVTGPEVSAPEELAVSISEPPGTDEPEGGSTAKSTSPSGSNPYGSWTARVATTERYLLDVWREAGFYRAMDQDVHEFARVTAERLVDDGLV